MPRWMGQESLKSEVSSRNAQASRLRAQVNDILSPLERAVRAFVYEHFVETTRAPDLAAIAAAANADPDAVAFALKRLADLHALVLAPATTTIWMAHPFSAVPTAYPVVIGGRTYWANCAW